MNPWASIGKLNKNQQRELQNKKLHHFITKHVYPFSPHYKKVFDENNINPQNIRTVEDLQRIPFTTKLDLQSDDPAKFKEFILQPSKEEMKKYWSPFDILKMKLKSHLKGHKLIKEMVSREYRPCFMTFTTGTTTTPTPFVYSSYDIQNLQVSGARMLDLFQVGDMQKMVNIFPYAPHLAFWQVVLAGLESSVFTLSTGGGKTLGTLGNIKAIEKMQPVLILGVPSYIYHVLRTAHEQGYKMPYIKKVVLGAAKVTVPFKKKLISLLEDMGASDVSVFGTYGFTEARCAWAEAPSPVDQSTGYYLYPDKEIFEVIDPDTGEVKGEGEDGELVYTTIDSRGSVVLRYRTGDFVKGGITYEPCPITGMLVPRISSDITRISNIKDLELSKVKGTLVNFNNFVSVLNSVEDIKEWQLEIRKKDNDPFQMDELVVYVTEEDGVDQAKLTDQIKQDLVTSTEISPNAVEFIALEDIVKRLGLETENKDRRIVDARPKE